MSQVFGFTKFLCDEITCVGDYFDNFCRSTSHSLFLSSVIGANNSYWSSDANCSLKGPIQATTTFFPKPRDPPILT